MGQLSFTTQLPAFATDVKDTGSSKSFTFKSGDQEVVLTLLPDRPGVVPVGSANTGFNLHCEISAYQYENLSKKITKVGICKFSVNIYTAYKKGVDILATSGYGRGTTVEDKAIGNSSLQFHESQHGSLYIQYLLDNPLPKPPTRIGMTVREYNKAILAFKPMLKKYEAEMGRSNKKQVDCVGTLPKLGYDRELDHLCYNRVPNVKKSRRHR